MRILLTGVNGQVGSALKPLLRSLGTVQAPPREELDLVDARAVAAWVRQYRPHLIVNAAAYTAVDRAEQEQAIAFALNAQLPEQLGSLQREVGWSRDPLLPRIMYLTGRMRAPIQRRISLAP
ncbi:dTDP-4-dehydrorhamnose reductase, partial [mine drainage metagenome]